MLQSLCSNKTRRRRDRSVRSNVLDFFSLASSPQSHADSWLQEAERLGSRLEDDGSWLAHLHGSCSCPVAELAPIEQRDASSSQCAAGTGFPRHRPAPSCIVPGLPELPASSRPPCLSTVANIQHTTACFGPHQGSRRARSPASSLPGSRRPDRGSAPSLVEIQSPCHPATLPPCRHSSWRGHYKLGSQSLIFSSTAAAANLNEPPSPQVAPHRCLPTVLRTYLAHRAAHLSLVSPVSLHDQRHEARCIVVLNQPPQNLDY